MSLASPTNDWVSSEEYLSGELHSELRHEYLAGEVRAMAGASELHNIISGNIFAALHAHLRGKPCRAFMNDMKVKIKAADRDFFYYPDVMVSCGPVGEPHYFKTDPVAIFEVLSPETENVDRREKFFAYTSLPSLKAYVLVDQEKVEVTVFRRDGEGWSSEYLKTKESAMRLDVLELDLSVAAIYEGVSPDAGVSA